MSRTRKILIGILVVLLLVVGLAAWKMRLPKPQSEFADLQPAPDFTLQDQDGRPFMLSGLRGARVVLVFYRGYW